MAVATAYYPTFWSDPNHTTTTTTLATTSTKRQRDHFGCEHLCAKRLRIAPDDAGVSSLRSESLSLLSSLRAHPLGVKRGRSVAPESSIDAHNPTAKEDDSDAVPAKRARSLNFHSVEVIGSNVPTAIETKKAASVVENGSDAAGPKYNAVSGAVILHPTLSKGSSSPLHPRLTSIPRQLLYGPPRYSPSMTPGMLRHLLPLLPGIAGCSWLPGITVGHDDQEMMMTDEDILSPHSLPEEGISNEHVEWMDF
eukprot:NODE_1828_length_1388_cov_44.636296_g1654_i0.p1 GENE.NODE_1828_length_1388_cov_44.636296_g1654_i0~~NODE_1828_length_1388_cov_44.636296_g1654_i0.p1  ORF type:complete len:294 (-),score=45.97 NODE_1828_length_1388_cov_44.636296_g1654_i0:505-1260(-)